VKQLLEALQETSEFDYDEYLSRYQAFYGGAQYVALVEYWNKRNNEAPLLAIQEFDWLYDRYFFLIEELHRQISLLSSMVVSVFELLEFFADVKLVLDTTRNLPKYLRVSSNMVDVFDIPVEEYLVKQGDTLESIALQFYGDMDRYVDIAEFNGIPYYEVNVAGWVGKLIKVPLILAKEQTRIPGIIDGQIGKSILGKDIKSEFAFLSNDIETVEHEDCFVQSIFLMLGEMPRGSLPEYPTLGNNLASIIGKNVGALSTNLIITDFQSLFNSDPTFANVRVTRVTYDEGVIQIGFEFSSILKQVKHSDKLMFEFVL